MLTRTNRCVVLAVAARGPFLVFFSCLEYSSDDSSGVDMRAEVALMASAERFLISTPGAWVLQGVAAPFSSPYPCHK